MRQALRWVPHDFFLAVRFLTRIPAPFGPCAAVQRAAEGPAEGAAAQDITAERLAGATRFFPVVGGIIGLATAGSSIVFNLVLPPLPAAALTLAAWIYVTGAMHLDGLMDSADGLLSHRGRERALEIMKDSGTGPMGVVAGISVLLVKVAAIASLGGAGAVAGLVVAPIVGRTSMVFCLALFPYARKDGMGAFSSRLSGSAILAPAIFGMLLVVAAGGPAGAATLAITVAAACAASSGVSGFLGGLTGDVYGAICEISEAAALVLWLALRDTLGGAPWM